MKTILPIRYPGGLTVACLITALGFLTPPLVHAETITITDGLGGYSQGFPPANGPFELYTQVVHSQGETYVIMPDETGIPKVTQISEHDDGTVTRVTVNLDQPDYRALNDAHNGYSIGIDEDGYIHIAGDMHAFGNSDGRQGTPPNPLPTYPAANEIYPVRYQFNAPSIPVAQRATILYWVSKKPRDVSGGFTFTGGANNPQRIPGSGWSYGRFFNDIHGKLFYSARVNARGWFIGALGVALNAYDAQTRTWEVRGTLPPAPSDPNAPAPFYASQKVLFWSAAGEPPTRDKPNRGYRNYQVYQVGFNFDQNNRLHFAVSGYVDLKGKARVLYASSDDAGLTWKRANGETINGPLLRGDPDASGDGQMTDAYDLGTPTLVLDEKGDSDPLNDTWVSGDANPTYITKVFADAMGTPAVLHGTTADNWRVLNPATGVWYKPAATQLKGVAGNISPDGTITTWSEYGIWRLSQLGAQNVSFGSGIISPSQLGIQQTGKIYGLVKTNGVMTVRKITFTPSPSTPGLGFVAAKWDSMPGRAITNLINDSHFPGSPDSVTLSPINGTFSAYYPTTIPGTGTRMRGYFIAPTTGNYSFKVWGKFGAELFVSTDESPQHRGSARVYFNDNLQLQLQSPILAGQWDRASVSNPIHMDAGHRYFVELLYKGASAVPFIEMGVTLPSGAFEGPVNASRFDPWQNQPPEIKTGIQVANLTSSQVQLSVVGQDEYAESTLKYSWTATGPAAVSFSAQGTNAAKNCVATFSQLGSYLCRVVVTDEEGLTATTSQVITIE